MMPMHIHQYLVENFNFPKNNDFSSYNENFIYEFSVELINYWNYTNIIPSKAREILESFRPYYINHPKLAHRLFHHAIKKSYDKNELFIIFLDIIDEINLNDILSIIKNSSSYNERQNLEAIFSKPEKIKFRKSQYKILLAVANRDIDIYTMVKKYNPKISKADLESKILKNFLVDVLIENDFDINTPSPLKINYRNTILADLIIEKDYKLTNPYIIHLIEKGANPFADFYDYSSNNKAMPLLHYYFHNIYNIEDTIHNSTELKSVLQLIPNLNTVDKWGRNILHMIVTSPNLIDSDELDTPKYLAETFALLIEAGVDPNQKAIPSNKEVIVENKLKGKLPNYYNKSPNDLLIEYFKNLSYNS